MASRSQIEWTQSTWNPWYGCQRVSPGCDHCYMYRDMIRYGRDPRHAQRSKTQFDAPLAWKEPRLIFTCSWSDFFIAEADPWREEAWEIIRRTPQHTYQMLTKRPTRMRDWASHHGWLPNVWAGTSVENRHYLHRLDVLAGISAPVRFVSAEPLLGPLDLRPWLDSGVLSWVIVGGESGPNARQMDASWAQRIRDQCLAAGVPFFLKQLGGVRNKRGGDEAILDGLLWRCLPTVQLALADA